MEPHLESIDGMTINRKNPLSCYIGATALRIITLSIMAFSIMGLLATLSIFDTEHK
jgi:hypothetical protein